MYQATGLFKSLVYKDIRQFQSKVVFTYQGTSTTFLDDKVMNVNILEEMNVINTQIPSNECKVMLNNEDGEMDILTYDKMYDIIASRPKIEIWFGGINTDTGAIVEWIPMGTFFLIEWQTDITNKTINITGRDNFDLLSTVSYYNTNTDTLFNLATDIFNNAGITSFHIDDSLKLISANFNDRTDSRTALQQIGICARTAVFQDRLGVMQLIPFAFLDESSNYLTFAGQSLLRSGTNWAYPLLQTDTDMKTIALEQMYDVPQISLDKSISEVVIKIYDTTEGREKVYTNDSLTGRGGSSFTLDNPLIDSEAIADNVAEWFIRESNYSAIYRVNWRQNPILEPADIIAVEDSFGANKQSRLYKQEFVYDGSLFGYSETRGGI